MPSVLRIQTVMMLMLALLLAGCRLNSQQIAPTPSPTMTQTPSSLGEAHSLATKQPTATASQTPLPTSTIAPAVVAKTANPPIATPVSMVPISGTAPTVTPTSVHGLIRSFTTSAAEANPGDTLTLTWETTAIRVRLCYYSAAVMPWGCWDVSPTGSRQVTIPTEKPNSYAYQLAAYPCQGDCQHETARVEVKVHCPDSWFFSGPSHQNLCPSTSAMVTAAAAQRFERGMMIWLEKSKKIYVLYSNSASSNSYMAFQDPWQEGMQESDPTIIPPAGLYQPVRGFGMIWRNETPYSSLRDTLGWATAPEFSFSSAYQCDTLWKLNDCYLQTPDGPIRMFGMSGWVFHTPTPGQ